MCLRLIKKKFLLNASKCDASFDFSSWKFFVYMRARRMCICLFLLYLPLYTSQDYQILCLVSDDATYLGNVLMLLQTGTPLWVNVRKSQPRNVKCSLPFLFTRGKYGGSQFHTCLLMPTINACIFI